MPIYFPLSIWVLLSVGSEPTPQAYFERGALFYNALTVSMHSGAFVLVVFEFPMRQLRIDPRFRSGNPEDNSRRGRAMATVSIFPLATSRMRQAFFRRICFSFSLEADYA